MKDDAVLAILADMHSGGTTSLAPRGQFQLLSGGYYNPSYLQGLIREQWVENIQAVKEQRKGKRLIVVINGDVIEGNHHGTVEIISPLAIDQRDIASQLIDEFLVYVGYDSKKGDTLRFTKGTPAHAGRIASEEEAIAADFDAVPFLPAGADSKARYLHPRLRLSINGRTFYIKHQGPSVGKRVHTEDNSLYLFLKDQYLRRGELFDYYIFSHRHQYTEACYSKPSAGVTLNGRITPSWQMRTGYGELFSDSDQIGALSFSISRMGEIKESLSMMEYEQERLEVC